MLIVCYPKCSTCQKAIRFLQEHQMVFDQRNIKEENPTAEEIGAWHAKSGLPLQKFFNTSGLQYRALGLKDRLAQMGEEEMVQLLASDGMLVKRPILVCEDRVLVGFREKEWQETLL